MMQERLILTIIVFDGVVVLLPTFLVIWQHCQGLRRTPETSVPPLPKIEKNHHTTLAQQTFPYVVIKNAISAVVNKR